jgi:hypothetical protein
MSMLLSLGCGWFENSLGSLVDLHGIYGDLIDFIINKICDYNL